MNRGQLVEAVAKEVKLPKAQVDAALSSIVKTIQASVKKGAGVKLVGFGTFTKVTRKARNGRNPKTGEKIKIAKKTTPKFSVSKKWKV
jgi:DNA-binding protein HU-beta